MALNVGELNVRMTLDDKELKKGLDSSLSSMKKVGKQMSALGKTMTLGLTLPLAAVGAASIKMASDVEEMEGKFNVVFQGMTDDVNAWATDFSDSISRSVYDVKEFAASFQDTFVPMGFARDKAAELSQALTELTFDLSSFYNKAESDVMRDMQSALVGNHETVRKYGIVITEAAIQQELLNMGISKSADEITIQEKVMARMNIIYAGTSDAQGDLIRTQESFENQLRALKAELKDVSVQMGQVLIPIVLKVIGHVNDAVQAFGNLDPAMQENIVYAGLLVAALGPVLMILGQVATGASAAAGAITALKGAFIGAETAGAAAGAGMAASLGAVALAAGAVVVGGIAIDKAIGAAVEAGVIDGYERSIDQIQKESPIDITVPVYATTDIIGMDVDPTQLQEQIDREMQIKQGGKFKTSIDLSTVFDTDDVEFVSWLDKFIDKFNDKKGELEQDAIDLQIEIDTEAAQADFLKLINEWQSELSGMSVDFGKSLADLTISLGKELDSSILYELNSLLEKKILTKDEKARLSELQGMENSFDIKTQGGLTNLVSILETSLRPENLATLGMSEDVINTIQGEPLQTAIEQLKVNQDIMQLASAQATQLAQQYDLTEDQKASLEGYLADVYSQAIGFEAQVISAIGSVVTAINALELSVTVDASGLLSGGTGTVQAAGGESGTLLTGGSAGGAMINTTTSDPEGLTELQRQNATLEEIKEALVDYHPANPTNADLIWKLPLY